MEVICIESEAFYKLLEEVFQRLIKIKAKEDKWIPASEAMRMLGIKSKTTLQRWRDEGRIRFTQPEKKVILYDRDSIAQFLEKHAKETF